MTLRGKWRIVEPHGHEADGAFPGEDGANAVQCECEGNDEMYEVCGDGWAQLDPDGSLSAENKNPRRQRNPLSLARGQWRPLG
jgi:hypothetical protein